MKKSSDVVVVGKGLAGLFAAITVAKKNKSVTLLSEGIGSLAIGGGAIDILGYVNSKLIINNPFNHISELGNKHPYKLIGKETVLEAVDYFKEITAEAGLNFVNHTDKNKTIFTVIGTKKPSFLSTESADASVLNTSSNILLVEIDGIKDYDVTLIKNQLERDYKDSKIIDVIKVASPFGATYRNVSSLDIARYVESEEGYKWLIDKILSVSMKYDLILLPPILGVEHHTKIYDQIKQFTKSHVIEMATIPPGVTGLRIYYALLKIISTLPITVIDNAKVVSADVQNNKCISINTGFKVNKKEIINTYFADNFIIATGGFLGGGLIATDKNIIEPIFKLDIKDAPSVIERSEKNVFADHFFATAGVEVNEKLKAVDNSGHEIMSNVYFAGKILAHYNFPREKSGYGVALSSAYHVAKIIG